MSSEYERYVNSDFVTHLHPKEFASFDVLGFWKEKETMFPVLSRMAMDIISVQASSVASESAFSTSERVLSIRRTRLTPASLEMCMCLKDHLDAKERKQDKCPLETPLDFEEGVFDDEVGYANDGKIALLEHAIFHNFLWRTPSPKVAIPESEFEKMPRMTLICISCRRFKKRIEGGKSNLYDKYCLFYKSVWMMRNIIHFYNLANQVRNKDVLTGKFKKLHEDLPAGFRNLEGETQ
ncbi:zinc finger BED domain-containing protein RICESLEEPER 2 [Tanacetum coccineum]